MARLTEAVTVNRSTSRWQGQVVTEAALCLSVGLGLEYRTSY